MRRTSWLAVVILIMSVVRPALAGGPSKETVELQAQMQTLVQMQQKINEEMGILRDKMNVLVQQTSESLSKVTTTVERLDKSMQQQQAASDSCVDQLTGQAQPLHDELTELRGRMDAIAKQLNEMNGFRQGAPAAAPATSAKPAAPNAADASANPK